MDIDRKFLIHAQSRHSGKVYTNDEGVFFKAADPAFLLILEQYPDACVTVGSDAAQVQAAALLVDRVRKYQEAHGVKVPDVDRDEHADLLAPNS